MLSWLRKFFTSKSVSASHSSVAVGRDNYGPIYIGHGITPPENRPAPLDSESLDAISPEQRDDISVHLAFSTFGVHLDADADAPFCTSVCLVTDAPDRLRRQLQQIRVLIQQDPLVNRAAKQRAENSSLQQLVENQGTRTVVLRELAVMSFSAYMYYCSKDDLGRLSSKEKELKLFVNPLLHRLSKKGEHFVEIHSNQTNITSHLKQAAEGVLSAFHRDVEVPRTGTSKYAVLEELAALIARACAVHLAEPANEEAASLFESLRTRIRYAENVTTGEKHKRDVNPLP